jgi:hypothetical protein
MAKGATLILISFMEVYVQVLLHSVVFGLPAILKFGHHLSFAVGSLFRLVLLMIYLSLEALR